MGATLSTKSLTDYSKEEIADVVASYGGKFSEYRAAIIGNGMDGAYFASLNEDEFMETLDDLGVSQRLHRRKLLNEFQKAIGSNPRRATLSRSGSSVSTSSRSSEASEAEEELRRLSEQEARNAQNLRASLHMLSDNERERSKMEKMKAPPQGRAAVVFTDVEGSTSLWETAPLVMRKALNLHDKTMRKHILKHAGYEAMTEGDSFFVVFHEATDALQFALDLQEALANASWDDELLALPWARQDKNGRQGLRVRMSVHMGNVKTIKDPCSERVTYTGEAVRVAKSLEKLAVGGQIIVSRETLNSASGLVAQVASYGSQTVASGKLDPTVVEVVEIAPASLNLMGEPKWQQ